MSAPSPRLLARIKRDFPSGSWERVVEELEAIPDNDDAFSQGKERIQAALVLGAAGDWYRFARLTELLRIDWRDTLMAGGLGDGDWSDILDRELPTVDPVAY